MGAAENAALIQRFYDEGWNANNLDVYDELVTEDFVDHQALPGLEPGREGFKMLNVMFRSAFPDVWVTVDQIVAEDDKVACRWTSTGTHEGDLFGIPPTGQRGQGHRDGLVPDRGRQARRGLDQPRRRRPDAPARRDPVAVEQLRGRRRPRPPPPPREGLRVARRRARRRAPTTPRRLPARCSTSRPAGGDRPAPRLRRDQQAHDRTDPDDHGPGPDRGREPVDEGLRA